MLPIALILPLLKTKLLGFVGFVLPFAKKHWKELLIALFIAYFAFSYHNLKKDNERLNERLVASQNLIKEFQTNEKAYLVTIGRQNDSILSYQRATQRAADALREAEEHARQRRLEYEAIIEGLRNSPPPPQECEGATNWLLDRAMEQAARRRATQ